MVFASEQEIYDIIRNNPNRELLEHERELSNSLRKYVMGEGLLDDMDAHDYEFEAKQLFEIKKKVSKSTRDLVERVLSPKNKVYQAKGGVRLYNMSESQDAAFEKYMNNVRRGMDMKSWIKNVADKAADIDPMSLLHVEVDESGKAYPTYKSTGAIYDYGLNGSRQVEYVVYELSKEDAAKIEEYTASDNSKLYRVIDDENEYYVSRVGEAYSIVLQVPHTFGKVPCVIASDVPVYDSVRFESRLMPIYEILKAYFEDDAGLNLYKKRQMYPREWSIEIACNKCKGTGDYDGEECSHCNGTGQAANIKQGARISISVGDDGKPMTPVPPGGFWQLPIKIVKNVREELSILEQQAKDTFWANDKVRKTGGTQVEGNSITTATGELINERSKEPKLREITKWAETTDRICTDYIKVVFYPNTKESTIKYGDRYMHGSPEELSEYYEYLKAKGAPISLLDKALIDIYEASFESNRIELAKHMILMRVEPFVHSTVQQVLSWNVTAAIKDKKLMYSEWLATKTTLEILTLGEDGCKKDLEKYVSGLVVSEINDNFNTNNNNS